MDEKSEILLKNVYKNTLQGAVVTYISTNKTVTLEDLKNFLQENYSGFRTPIGAKYKGKNYEKVIKGLLADPVFQVKEKGISINVKAMQKDYIEEFEAKKMATIHHHKKRFKGKIDFPPVCTPNKYSQKIHMIENFCSKLKKDLDFAKIFDAPFKVISK
jgi:hypothetical protein